MRRGDLFVLIWESLRRVEWGKVSSFLSMSGSGMFNSLVNYSTVSYTLHLHHTEGRSAEVTSSCLLHCRSFICPLSPWCSE